MAYHTDTLGAMPSGDCFSFAELYYNLSGKELLNKINQELNLHLAVRSSRHIIQYPQTLQ